MMATLSGRLDGSKIVFDSNRSGDPEIYVMNANGSNQTSLTVGPDFDADFSPDGSKIVFSSTRDGDEEIYVMNADGSNQTRLIFEPGNDGGADWQRVPVPPACGAAEASPTHLWPPNHELLAVQIVGVSDPASLNLTLTVTGVTQDEPVEGPGDGHTSPDAVVQGQELRLRAERAGTGNGRVYQVTFNADDGVGGTCTGTVKVGVPHDRHSTAVDDGQLYDSLEP